MFTPINTKHADPDLCILENRAEEQFVRSKASFRSSVHGFPLKPGKTKCNLTLVPDFPPLVIMTMVNRQALSYVDRGSSLQNSGTVSSDRSPSTSATATVACKYVSLLKKSVSWNRFR
jgi:hypothetical protein